MTCWLLAACCVFAVEVEPWGASKASKAAAAGTSGGTAAAKPKKRNKRQRDSDDGQQLPYRAASGLGLQGAAPQAVSSKAVVAQAQLAGMQTGVRAGAKAMIGVAPGHLNGHQPAGRAVVLWGPGSKQHVLAPMARPSQGGQQQQQLQRQHPQQQHQAPRLPHVVYYPQQQLQQYSSVQSAQHSLGQAFLAGQQQQLLVQRQQQQQQHQQPQKLQLPGGAPFHMGRPVLDLAQPPQAQQHLQLLPGQPQQQQQQQQVLQPTPAMQLQPGPAQAPFLLMVRNPLQAAHGATLVPLLLVPKMPAAGVGPPA